MSRTSRLVQLLREVATLGMVAELCVRTELTWEDRWEDEFRSTLAAFFGSLEEQCPGDVDLVVDEVCDAVLADLLGPPSPEDDSETGSR